MKASYISDEVLLIGVEGEEGLNRSCRLLMLARHLRSILFRNPTAAEIEAAELERGAEL